MHSTEERRMHITGYFRVRINTYQGRWGALKFGACVMTTAASASAPRESESSRAVARCSCRYHCPGTLCSSRLPPCGMAISLQKCAMPPGLSVHTLQ
eukprot:scaffold67648_cov17-Tisochrysis_lutea.AAC.2